MVWLSPAPTDCIVYHGSYVPLEGNAPTEEQFKEQLKQLEKASGSEGCPRKRRWDTWGFSI